MRIGAGAPNPIFTSKEPEGWGKQKDKPDHVSARPNLVERSSFWQESAGKVALEEPAPSDKKLKKSNSIQNSRSPAFHS